MSKLVNNPNYSGIYTTSQNLSTYCNEALEATATGKDIKISYNSETNKYDYCAGNSSISLYSTADVLKYHFGEEADSVLESGEIFIVTQGSDIGVDTIIYKGQILGFGASDEITNSKAIQKAITTTAKDIALEYVGKYIEENKGLAENVAFKLTETGIDIYSTVSNTDNETNYNVSEFPEMVIGFTDFSSSFVGSIGYSKVLEDLTKIGVLNNAKTFFYDIGVKLYANDNGYICPDENFIDDLTGYDEYYEKHGTGGIEYNGEEMIISLEDSVLGEYVQKYVKSEIDEAIEEANKEPNWLEKLLLEYNYANLNTPSTFWGTKLGNYLAYKYVSHKNKNKVLKASNTVYDPIILDLDGDGFNVEAKENGTNFDLADLFDTFDKVLCKSLLGITSFCCAN